MSEIGKNEVIEELCQILGLQDPVIAVEQVRALKESLDSGADDVASVYAKKAWDYLTFWRGVAEGVKRSGYYEPITEPETKHHADELVEILAISGLELVVPKVIELRDALTESYEGDSIVHFYERKIWRSAEDWKATAEGLEVNPYGRKVLKIRINPPSDPSK